MSKITYEDKEPRGQASQPGVTDTWRHSDANEIKEKFNALVDTVDQLETGGGDGGPIIHPWDPSLPNIIRPIDINAPILTDRIRRLQRLDPASFNSLNLPAPETIVHMNASEINTLLTSIN